MGLRHFLPVVLCLSASAAPQNPQTSVAARLNIVVVQGEGAINNIKQRTSRDTVVQVEDENHRPLAGASVVFMLPNDGPGGTFAGGAKTAALVTDSNGQAVMPRVTANQFNGQYQIRVSASYDSRHTNRVINQSNIAVAGAGGAAATHAGMSGKLIGILVGVAAAGAIGAAVGLRGGGSSAAGGTIGGGPAPASPTTGSVTGPVGTIIGPPR